MGNPVAGPRSLVRREDAVGLNCPKWTKHPLSVILCDFHLALNSHKVVDDGGFRIYKKGVDIASIHTPDDRQGISLASSRRIKFIF